MNSKASIEIIEQYRDKLNKMIEENVPFDEIYRLSTDLDKLILVYITGKKYMEVQQ